MTIWLTIVAVGLITYLIRLSFIALVGYRPIPDRLKHALRFVPLAVLTAIIFPELILSNGVVDLSPDNFRLFAGLAAVIVAWRTRSVVATILVGIAVLAILALLFN